MLPEIFGGVDRRRTRQRGGIDELPSGALRVRVYSGMDPIALKRPRSAVAPAKDSILVGFSTMRQYAKVSLDSLTVAAPVTMLDVLVASPGDAKAGREAVERALHTCRRRSQS